MTLQPVHVQIREDQLLGAAWRRAEAACRTAITEPGAELALVTARTGYYARVQSEHDGMGRHAETPAAALDALSAALAARDGDE